MNLAEFLSSLLDKHIKLWGEGDQLRFRAPAGAMTQEIKSILKNHKAEILEFLRINNQAVDAVTPTIVPGPIRNEVPLSFAQERLWFLDQLEPGTIAYNMPGAVRLKGELSVQVLEQAIHEILRRHEVLRTHFKLKGDSPVQVIEEAQAGALEVIDLTGMTGAEQETEVVRLMRREAQAPFDLSRGPLLRVKLARLGIQEHVLFFTMHHIISDGWSMGVLMRELSQLYAAYAQGKPSPLPELTIQYADYAQWQRSWLSGEVLAGQLDYWKSHLKGAPAVLELPFDHPRPVVQSHAGAIQQLALSREVSGELKRLSQREGVTLFMSLLAAFRVLLNRYTGQTDIVVGTPIANRNRIETEGLIGFFVNTLALRSDLAGNPTFLELLQKEREVALGAYAHQDVPFEQLVQELEPERSLSHSPIFQVMFILENNVKETLQLDGLKLEPVGEAGRNAKFDLTLGLTETTEGISGVLEYNTDLFEATTIKRLAAHWEKLVTELVKAPDQRLSQVELLNSTEREQLLVTWNRTSVDYPWAGCIHELFEMQVKQSPQAIALVCGEKKLTYQELNARANQLAHHLGSVGVGPEVLVGICVERSLEMVIGLLGILKAGGAYVPLDPNYPRERLEFMLKDADVAVLLTQRHLKERLPSHAGRMIYLDRMSEQPGDESSTNPRVSVQARNLAYVIYTSGSTGRPKGVMAEHGAMLNRFQWMWEKYPFAAGEVLCQKTTLSFVDSIWEIFGPLLRGVRSVIIEDAILKDVPRLVEILARQEVSRLVLVPSLLRVILESGENLAGSLTRLKYWFVSGEALPADLARCFVERFGGKSRLINLYGSSEVSADVSYYEVEGGESAIPIGRPMANTQLFILDGDLRPVPVGVSGELYVGGANLARGYLKQPQLTLERFVTHPFSKEPGARLYRTGDLCRYRADGQIEYLGRADHQVKVRGFRIELGEIESVLSRHPGVKQSVIMVREDHPGDKRLVGYVVGHEKTDVSTAELKEYLKSKLPDYMVPGVLVLLGSLPLTPSGKVDRRALPMPESGNSEKEYVAPRAPSEELLAGIWREVLKVERVGIEDNFFELGGHSLLATRLMSRVRQTLSVELPLRDLFEAPTVAELSKRVEAAQVRGEGVSMPPLKRVQRNEELSLSFAQERLWFIDQLEPGNLAYNLPGAVRLKGKLMVGVLERAINEILRRHEVLRTRYELKGNQPVQVIEAPRWRELSVTDLSGLAGEVQREVVREFLRTEGARPFDLSAGPVVRVGLLRLGEEEQVLYFTMHHIASDGWSTGVLNRELGLLYQAYARGEASPLPELAIQYADYALWQRGWLSGEVLAGQLQYWREQLKGVAPLELPTDWSRPAVQSFKGAMVPIRIQREVAQGLRELGQKEGTTLFMSLLAAFQILLYRYTGQSDLAVGTPIANRNRSETESLIGCFVNTLVLRTRVSGDPSVRELLHRVREVTLGAYEHQDLPFEKLVEELQPERDLSRNPLFQVIFELLNAPNEGVELPGLSLQPLRGMDITTRVDLEVHMREQPEGLGGWVFYNTDLFLAATMERLVGHWERIVAAMVADPTRRLSEVEFLSESEREELLVGWNNTEKAYPEKESIARVFEEQVRRTPKAMAVACGGESLSYEELNAKANQLAHHLQSLGVGAEVLVGICAERSLEMIIGLLGILKAGGAYVPLDPNYPLERLSFMLEDAGVAVLLTQSHLEERLPSHGAIVVHLDEGESRLTSPKVDNPQSGVSGENLAYLIYTSGSTGQPKGVMLTHRGLCNLVHAQASAFQIKSEDRVFQFASIAFDASVWEIFTTWTAGATLCLASGDSLLPGPDMVHFMRQQAITHATLPPSILAALSTEGLASLQSVVSAGENCGPEILSRWLPQRRFINAYGPTEATVCASLIISPAIGERTSIGRPLANVSLYILSADSELIPVGAIGELYIGGAGLARGYHGRPDLTGEKFIPHPFSSEPGARLYRTGDLCRYLPDGNIEYLGRIDHQVKVRGFRIELGEIENVLSQHPEVEQSVVVVREDTPGDKRLVGYLVGRGNVEPEMGALKEYLRERLPEHMVPAVLVRLGSMPLTPNGKVDRKALPKPDLGSNETVFIAPRNPGEELLAGIWREVLHAETVSVHDSFFELGGHSLLATQVMSRMREVLGVELPLRDLFEAPTLAALSERVETARQNGKPSAPALIRAERGMDLPLSFAQERLWFLDRLEPGNAAYHIPGAVRIRGELQREALELSLSEILHRHEALRTTFELKEGKPVQVIQPAERMALEVQSLEAVSPEERERQLRQLAEAEARAPFDLSHGPLLRVKLVQLSDDEHVLLYTLHHIISDGWSMGVLVRELSLLYEAYVQGKASPLPELPIQYADYAVWQREWLKGEVLADQLNYWKDHLKGAPAVLELPTDHPRPVVQSHAGAVEKVSLSKELSTQLKELSQREGVTLFMMLLAAFRVLLNRYTGQTDIVVGTPIANRNRRETEGLIGFFVNTLALRSNLAGDPTFLEVLQKEREVALGAYAHQDVPFEQVVQELQTERNLSHSPIFQVMLALRNAPGEALKIEGLTFNPAGSESRTAKFDLTLELQEGTEGVNGVLEYNTDLFEAATIQRMVRHLERVLAAMVADPTQRVSELEFLSESERKQLLISWNNTQREYPQDQCIHELFAAQAERTPEAIALVCGEEQLSYGELNRRANQLAHYLRALGVGPEVLVGICVERSIEMVMGLLGILKAGGAYVPLDPGYPPERLEFMLQDAQPKVLLSQRKFTALLTECSVPVVYLDEALTGNGKLPEDNPPSGVTGLNLAYMIYTSGSTGRPKGAMNTHTGIRNRLQWMQAAYGLTNTDRILQKTPFSFDVSVWEFFWPLMYGATLVVARPGGHQDPQYLVEIIRQAGITTLHFVPSMLQAFLGAQGVEDCQSVRRVICSGEALPYGLQEQFFGCLPAAQLHNLYGPTEAAVDVTYWACERKSALRIVPIGEPIANIQCYILNTHLQLVPVGVGGELYLGGVGLGRGYLNRAELTAEKFIPDPFSKELGARLYRTGDLCRYLPDGNIEYLGRIDHQVKVRGFRIELGEIESVLNGHPEVEQSVVVVREDHPGDKRLVAYVVGKGKTTIESGQLREYLQGKLPEYMVPGVLVLLENLPLSPNGKVDRRALPAPEGRQSQAAFVAPQNELEKLIAGIWRELLGVESVGIHDNFFELGGHSLLLVRVHGRLQELLEGELSMVELFQFPTIHRLAEHLSGGQKRVLPVISKAAARRKEAAEDEIAIIGMAGRFPGASNLEEFWQNLRNGVESISFFTDEELAAAGVEPRVLQNPNYVKARGVLAGIDLFDAGFFGYSPREAELIDPQQRIFLECAWEALEQAGYAVESHPGVIGVYAGTSINSYVFNIFSNSELMSSMDPFQITLSNGNDFLSTRISYKLNLRGPSINVQTACSTSLVAVHMACESLLAGKCDLALAGAVSAAAQQKMGYLHKVEGIGSPDGHCRAFDARAEGTVSGSGVGIVVLKRLSEALADGDQIHAVIKGSAINNDGSLKVGYTAPSVTGQAQAIAMAQELGGVEPESLSYVEAHGTGTLLGDPIEVAALTQAFGGNTSKKGFCAIGSVKTNIGHLDAAAGVAGLIKTVLALKHEAIPPSLHFETPNPKIDFAGSPFYVNAKLSEWRRSEKHPRRAGVSSFGMGGTNAHVVLEEAPPVEPSSPSRKHQLLLFSARTSTALDQATVNLANHLKGTRDSLADVAYTLQVGRRAFGQRRMLVCHGKSQAIEALEGMSGVETSGVEARERPVVFFFSGQGSQYVNMGRELYKEEGLFRQQVDQCCELLQKELGLDLRQVLYPERETEVESLRDTALAQPALFVVEYALARLWLSWGVEPQAMMGHSIGEYVAACLAGVFTLEEALHLVAVRGRLVQALPGGSMIAVSLSGGAAEELLQEMKLQEQLSLAAVNGPKLSVVSGAEGFITRLEKELERRKIACQRLHTSHAFHSVMMEEAVEPFVAEVRKIRLRAPTRPYLSNLTGKWITKSEATDPAYWGRHLRGTVLFSEGLQELLKGGEQLVFLEVGPGQSLSTLARGHFKANAGHVVAGSIRHIREEQSDQEHLLRSLGRLWLSGVKINWSGFYAGEKRQRVPLPTYPFERQRYWIERQRQSPATTSPGSTSTHKRKNIDEWLYAPYWRRFVSLPPKNSSEQGACCLAFVTESEFDLQLLRALKESGWEMIAVKAGSHFAKLSEWDYSIRPGARADYDELIKDIRERQRNVPSRLIHLWSARPGKAQRAGNKKSNETQESGFLSLLFLTQALAAQHVTNPLQLDVVTSGLQDVQWQDAVCPEKTAILGLCKVIPREYPHISCRSIDIVVPKSKTHRERLIKQLVAELQSMPADKVVAYREDRRWVQGYKTLRPEINDAENQDRGVLRQGGVYLITGGLGDIGLTLAQNLAERLQAKLILVGGASLPPRSQWEQWLEIHKENILSQKISRVQAMEKLGAEVLVSDVDMLSGKQMARVLIQAEKRFGSIHGVIHAAGVAEPITLQEMKVEHWERQFLPTIHGLRGFAKLLEKRQLDFCCLTSSLAAVLGGVGFGAHAAANRFLEAFAQQQNRTSAFPWISVNWDVWNLRVDAATQEGRTSPGGTPEEGWLAFTKTLSAKTDTTILVSREDLQARIDKSIDQESLRTPHERGSLRWHPRPEISSQYAAPTNEAEQTMTTIWGELLGIEKVGIQDNFFELGGHSLLATQLMSRIREMFGVELPLRDLFEAPTVVGLNARLIKSQGRSEKPQVEKIRRLENNFSDQNVPNVGALSDDEVDSLLRKLMANQLEQ